MAKLPPRVDGRQAILEMRHGGSRHWRQMEWMGFYLEYFVETRVARDLGLVNGPTFGNTKFDYRLRRVWDLKTHPRGVTTAPMNDCEAIHRCIKQFGGVGFLIAEVDPEYDEAGTFKAWHDELKGGRSRYEEDRIARRAPSRRRKVAFQPVAVTAVFLSSRDDIDQGIEAGWLSEFQRNMRNSDGSPRRAKYAITPSKVPASAIVARVKYAGLA